MGFKNDCGGFVFDCSDIKISLDSSTWSTRLSQLAKIKGTVWISTRSIENTEYVSTIIGKRPQNINILAHVSAQANAEKLKKKFPNISIALHKNINAKIVLIEPDTVWISSGDFGCTTQIESTIGLHSKIAYDKYLELQVKKLWMDAEKI